MAYMFKVFVIDPQNLLTLPIQKKYSLLTKDNIPVFTISNNTYNTFEFSFWILNDAVNNQFLTNLLYGSNLIIFATPELYKRYESCISNIDTLIPTTNVIFMTDIINILVKKYPKLQ